MALAIVILFAVLLLKMIGNHHKLVIRRIRNYRRRRLEYLIEISMMMLDQQVNQF